MNCYFCQKYSVSKWCQTCYVRTYIIPPDEKPYMFNYNLTGRHSLIDRVKINHVQMNLFPSNLTGKIMVVDGNFMDTTPETIIELVDRVLNLTAFL